MGRGLIPEGRGQEFGLFFSIFFPKRKGRGIHGCIFLSCLGYLFKCVCFLVFYDFFLTACDVSPELRVEASGRSLAHP